MNRQLYPKLSASCMDLLEEAEQIGAARRAELTKLADYLRTTDTPRLLFVCTHNSRRSHLAQAWAWVAGLFFNRAGVTTYSGGTETTALYPQAGVALKDAGFELSVGPEDRNPKYTLKAGGHIPPIFLWSKVFDDASNPKTDFAVVTVCSAAEEACPAVPGTSVRIHLPYEDPKAFDDTKRKASAYIERSHQIGREMLWAFREAYSTPR
jgi:arsenate reductase